LKQSTTSPTVSKIGSQEFTYRRLGPAAPPESKYSDSLRQWGTKKDFAAIPTSNGWICFDTVFLFSADVRSSAHNFSSL
jgi:hypothetical protein